MFQPKIKSIIFFENKIDTKNVIKDIQPAKLSDIVIPQLHWIVSFDNVEYKVMEIESAFVDNFQSIYIVLKKLAKNDLLINKMEYSNSELN